MNPNDLTHALLGAIIALELWHLRLHSSITSMLADHDSKLDALWRAFVRRTSPR